MQTDHALFSARQTFDTEIAALTRVRDNLDQSFICLTSKCLQSIQKGGKIVICGIGKSGHIGAKIAATLASTGSPAVFLHPVEAMHGDLGVLSENDLLLAISYSGETEEVLALLPAAKRLGVTVAGITGNLDNSLTQWSEVVIPMTVEREACPFNLAPTSSTTALAALGDALAIALLQAQGFSENDYALLHPSGTIGRTMTLRVEDVMRSGENFAKTGAESTIKEVLMLMTRLRCGCVTVVDKKGRLEGIFTDGDFRRRITNDQNLFDRSVGELMSRHPVTVDRKTLAAELLHTLEQHKIDDIPVVEADNAAVGIVDIQDLPRFKII